MINKVVNSAQEAVADIHDGATILFSGPGTSHCWTVDLIKALRDKGSRNLTLIMNLALGSDSPHILLENGQVKKLIACFGALAGIATEFEKVIAQGKVEFELVPQGILVERCRAGGAGIPAFYSPVGVGTVVEKGKEKRIINGREYILEEAITADFAFVNATRADPLGNLAYHGTARAFSVMATAAKVTIAEVEKIVEPGEIHPDHVGMPGIYVDRVLQSTFNRAKALAEHRSWMADRLTIGAPVKKQPDIKVGLSRELIGLRIANELHNGDYVNLGFGLPALVTPFAQERGVILQMEWGILNYAALPSGQPPDLDVYGASGEFLTIKPGGSFFSVIDAHAMARGGHMDAVVLGAYQVSEDGSFANIQTPRMSAPGVGGAMDLISGGARVIIAMEHITDDGQPRILKKCTYPLTGLNCVSMIITDLAVIDVTPQGLVLKEIAPGWTADEVQALTEPKLVIADDLKEIQL